MKALILARGLGKRMREAGATELTNAQQAAAASGSKAMMPIGHRPFLDFVISSLADAGCRQIGLLIAPDHDEIRRRYTRDLRPERVSIEFVVQPDALGTAHAVGCAEAWAEGAHFLTLNADNLYPTRALIDLIALDGPGLPVFRRDALVRDSNIPAERVAAFALLDIGAGGVLQRIVEKPGAAAMRDAGPNAAVSMNVWRFDTRIFDACRDVPKSARGEYELPQAVGLAIERGVKFQTFDAQGAVLDLSRRDDVAAVEARLARTEPRL